MSKTIQLTFKCIWCGKETTVCEGDLIYPCKCNEEDMKSFQKLVEADIGDKLTLRKNFIKENSNG